MTDEELEFGCFRMIKGTERNEVYFISKITTNCKRCSTEIPGYTNIPLCNNCINNAVKEFFSGENDNLTIKEFREKIENGSQKNE